MLHCRLQGKSARAITRGSLLAYGSCIALESAVALAALVLVAAMPTVGAAATLAEVAHCRGLEKAAERVSCFKSLKHSANARREDSAAPEAKNGTPANTPGQATLTNPGADAANASDTQRVPAEQGETGRRSGSAKARGSVPTADPLEHVKPGVTAKEHQVTKATQDLAAPAVPAGPESAARTEQASPPEGKLATPAKSIAVGSGEAAQPPSAQKESAAPDPARQVDTPKTGAAAKVDRAVATNADQVRAAGKERPAAAQTTPSVPAMAGQAVPVQKRQDASSQAAVASPLQVDHNGPMVRAASPQTGRGVSHPTGPDVLVPTGGAVFPPVSAFPATVPATAPSQPPTRRPAAIGTTQGPSRGASRSGETGTGSSNRGSRSNIVIEIRRARYFNVAHREPEPRRSAALH